ncbi:hypothetical protein ABZ413_32555 [Nocardia rhamnosiphila]|uniref:hypothetical protein n=1 Tax=Nocardia rhamnosiphila TaxID=426716 RepID=UPI0033EFA5AB
MGKPTRRNQRKRLDRVDVLASNLPLELESFSRWYYTVDGDPTGLRDYLSTLAVWVDQETGRPDTGRTLGLKVMDAVGLSVAEWYRHVLSEGVRSGMG